MQSRHSTAAAAATTDIFKLIWLGGGERHPVAAAAAETGLTEAAGRERGCDGCTWGVPVGLSGGAWQCAPGAGRTRAPRIRQVGGRGPAVAAAAAATGQWQ